MCGDIFFDIISSSFSNENVCLKNDNELARFELILKQVELSFKTGEVILVYGDMDEDGFFMGELDGVRGLVPSNFLTEAPEQYNNQGGTTGANGIGAQRNQNTTSTSLIQNQRNSQPTGPGARGPPPPPREMGSMGKFFYGSNS